ncbi:MAG: endolytic transglycosylase MltG [Nitrospiraceae bacterium]|nr:endolytic transglycosylase MltG [Nitrospiraceae bacterium]
MMKRQIAFFLAVSAGLIVLYAFIQFSMPVSPSKGTEEVHIAQGMTFSRAAALLKSKGYIGDKRLFILAARLTGADRRLKPGYYVLNGLMSPWTIFELLKNGRLLQNEVTVVEGESLRGIKRTFVREGVMNAENFDRLITDRSFLAKLDINAPSLEGYLFPDTYLFPKGEGPRQVLETMVRRLMQAYLGGGLQARALAMGLSLNSVLTLASMVEREAELNSERPIIAAVFLNRLKKGMPLQCDPTAVYGVKPFSEGVTSADLKNRTMYNTYIIKGLPPGPIDNPGIKSIEAVLYPAKVNYLYFVSNYDGTHTFSVTYAGQEQAILRSRGELKEKDDETAKDN